MNLFKSLAATALLSSSLFAQATSVDEIISTYHENIGGVEALKQLKGVKMTGNFQQGQMQFPIEIVNLDSGKTYTKFSVQGKDFKQAVYDGETLWSINMMTLKPEKSTAEDTYNFSLNSNDFPDALMDYKAKGYTAELVGTETVEGADAYKIKLTQEPIKLEGKEVPNVSYHYFDADSMVLVMTETELHSGPMKGATQIMKFSDYQEVDSLYFPFAIMSEIKGQPGGSPITIKSVELNPSVDNAVFDFPTAPAAE
ncbi:hypothetical protein ACFSJY_04965 [Thalassotalea euphylliae]|uniref:hypothetical protein n=1 Tax=Thalassotalea euphylliae TaxID=1655234 RepID=UPI00362B6F9F